MRFQSTAAALLSVLALAAVPVSAQTAGKKPNILVIFGDDIGYWNIGAYNQGCTIPPPPAMKPNIGRPVGIPWCASSTIPKR